MNLLLDANALLWWWESNKKLGRHVRGIVVRDACRRARQRRDGVGDRDQVASQDGLTLPAPVETA